MRFSHHDELMVFYWSLCDGKWPHVPRSLLNNLADLNNAVVWMVSVRPPISSFSSFLTQLFENVSNAPITISINTTLIIHKLFSFLFIYFFFFFHFYSIIWSEDTEKSTIWQVCFFCWLSLGLIFWTGLGDLFVSRNSKEICEPHSPG